MKQKLQEERIKKLKDIAIIHNKDKLDNRLVLDLN